MRWLLACIIVLFLTSKNARATSDVSSALDEVDTTQFLQDVTEPVEGSDTGIIEMAMRSPQVKLLIENECVAIPLMVERFRSPVGIKNDGARSIYLIVFGESADVRVLPIVADILDAPSSATNQKIKLYVEPFAVYATQSILGIKDARLIALHKEEVSRLLRFEYELRLVREQRNCVLEQNRIRP